MKYRRKEKEMKNLKRGNSGAPKKVDRSCSTIYGCIINFITEQMNGNRSKNMYTNDKNYIHLKVKRHPFPFPISSRFFGINPVESVKRHFYKGLRSGTK
jgi:hypothetical protein